MGQAHAIVGKPYDDVPIDQVQDEDLHPLHDQHPVQVEPVAVVRAWKSLGFYYLVQKICIFSDQEREDGACEQG